MFTFNFYRFVGTVGHRSTELVRDHSIADGMRGLVEKSPEQIQLASTRVNEWAKQHGITINTKKPYPSDKYPGRVWLEFRFAGLTL